MHKTVPLTKKIFPIVSSAKIEKPSQLQGGCSVGEPGGALEELEIETEKASRCWRALSAHPTTFGLSLRDKGNQGQVPSHGDMTHSITGPL